VIVQPVVAVEHVAPPGDAVAVYDVIADPPFDAGAVHETAACAFPGVADTPVGAPGTTTPAPQALPVRVAVEVQVPERARTCGVTFALVDRSTVSPFTAVASVVVPSVTSYVSPAGGSGLADAVQVTRHVDPSTRVTATDAGM
jgi:hypothetical protein